MSQTRWVSGRETIAEAGRLAEHTKQTRETAREAQKKGSPERRKNGTRGSRSISTTTWATMMRLHVLSDLHIEFGAFEPPHPDVDAVVLAGDIHLGVKGVEWAREHFEAPAIYIAGNHEYYKQHLQKNLEAMRAAAKETNVRFLENDAVEVGGVTFLGCTLWTDFNAFGDPTAARQRARDDITDYRVIRTGEDYRTLRPYDTERMNAESVAWLKKEFERRRGERIVVVTHHSPSLKSVPDRFRHDPLSASFSSDFDWLVELSAAPLWIHGHTHDSFDYRIGRTRLIANPRGYVGVEPNPRFNPALVVEV
jgi:predicted phosphodiesterase